jgi:hypothetical protein
MATRRPLVIVNGDVSELPFGDSVAGSGGLNTGVVELDFGVGFGSSEASVSVTGLSGIVSNSAVSLVVCSDDSTASHTQNDHKYLPLVCNFSYSIQPNTGLTINAVSQYNLNGSFKIRYSWS